MYLGNSGNSSDSRKSWDSGASINHEELRIQEARKIPKIYKGIKEIEDVKYLGFWKFMISNVLVSRKN